MDKSIKEKILSLCSTEFKNALTIALSNEDYDNVLLILEEEYASINENIENHEFFFFNLFHESMLYYNHSKFLKIMNLAEKLYFLKLARVHILNLPEYMNNTLFGCQNSKVDINLFFINRIGTITKKDMMAFYDKLFLLNQDRFFVEDALDLAFSLNGEGDNRNIEADYLESLIHSNPFTYEKMMTSLLEDDPKALLVEYKKLKKLRQKFYTVKSNDIKKLKRTIKNIEQIGLKESKKI